MTWGGHVVVSGNEEGHGGDHVVGGGTADAGTGKRERVRTVDE
jgi:hypothetical protein